MKYSLRRTLRWWWRRRIRGFDDRELWSLDYTICKFVLPRLREFAKEPHGFPGEFLYGENATPDEIWEIESLPPDESKRRDTQASDEWKKVISKMIKAMEIWVEDDCWVEPKSQKEKDWKEGMDLFHKYFFALWN